MPGRINVIATRPCIDFPQPHPALLISPVVLLACSLLAAEVPPGRFWELNVVRDCPVGLYRENYVNVTDPVAISCRSCPDGWTTNGTAKGSIYDCIRELV